MTPNNDLQGIPWNHNDPSRDNEQYSNLSLTSFKVTPGRLFGSLLNQLLAMTCLFDNVFK
jgi:hypothetical protein